MNCRSCQPRTVCFQCFRAERERRRARRLVAPSDTRPVQSPFFRGLAPFTTLTAKQVAHRQAMLAFARTALGETAT